MKKFSKLLSVMLSLTLCASMVAPAFAVSYDIDKGSVYVEKDDDGVYSYQGSKTSGNVSRDTDITVTGSTEKNTIVVGKDVEDVTITLDNVNISSTDKAAMSIGANSDVTVELDGENTLNGGNNHAGLELNDKDGSGRSVYGAKGGSVTIQDNNDEEGSLTATGGNNSAGVGSGSGGTAGNITISNAEVTAAGVGNGAGIGSGSNGKVGNITIDNAEVTATGGEKGAAGIGTGWGGYANGSITINNGSVTAAGGTNSAGIGGGYAGDTSDITINGANVTATGGNKGAGIGSSYSSRSKNSNIVINGAEVKAAGGNGGAGIGSSSGGSIGGITIRDSSVTATGGNYGSGIGTGQNGKVTGDITITDTHVNATGGNFGSGIGSGSSGTTKNIIIEGGVIIAKSGNKAVAIGSNYSTKVGTITLKDIESLIALSAPNAVSPNNSAIGGNSEKEIDHDQGILNGDLSTMTDEAAGKTIHIIDREGNEIVSFDAQSEGSTTKWNSFAAILPAGTYYMYATSDTDPEPRLIAQANDSYAYIVEDGAVRDVELNVLARDVDVEYEFASSDPDMELPEGLLVPPETVDGHVLTLDDLLNGITCDETYEDIEVDGGVWSFNGWTTVPVLGEDGSVTNEPVKVVGTWTFTANAPDPVVTPEKPVTPPTGGDDVPVVEAPGEVELDETAVPLASGPVTRAEFIDYLWRHEGKPASDGVCTFTDVAEDHDYVLALAWAEQSGVAVAYEDGAFEPDELVTVGAVREFLSNFARVFGTNAVTVSDLVSLTGADDEAVLSCGEILAEFFGEECTSANGEDIQTAA